MERGVRYGESDGSGSEFLPEAQDGAVLSWGIWPSNTWMKNSRRTPKTWTHSQHSLICLGAVENRMAIGAKRTKSTVWWVAVYLLLFTASILPPTGIQAHPHVFIVQRINAVFDDKGLAGFRMWWKFDDMFASMIAEDHDLNRCSKVRYSKKILSGKIS